MPFLYRAPLMLLLMLLTLAAVSACGFKLRHQMSLPVEMRTLYLQTANPYGTFEASLKQVLQASGVKLADSPIQTPITLTISKPLLTTNSTTLGTSNEARVYSVVYRVDYSLMDRRGKLVLPPESVTVIRSLTLNANQLLASNDQLAVLTREMEREAINQMLNRLSARQVKERLGGAR